MLYQISFSQIKLIYSNVFTVSNIDPRMGLPIDFIYIIVATIIFFTKTQCN